MYINTRARALTLTTIATILFAFIQYGYLKINFLPITSLNLLAESLLLGLLVFVGICWVVEWKIRYIRFFTVAFFPAIFITVFTFFVRLSLLQSFLSLRGWLFSFFLLVVFIFLLYFLILNSNILNIGSLTAVPLERAAKTAQYIYSLIFGYLLTVVVYSLALPIYARLLIVVVMFFYLTYQTFWTLNISSKELINLTIAVGSIFSLWAFIISLWPMPPAFVAIAFTTFLYLTFGLGLDRVGKISILSRIEYFTVLAIVLTFCIMVSTWGINGRLIKF